MNARSTGAALGMGALAIIILSGAARAQDAGTPSCDDATMFPNPIVLTGSTAFQPVIQAMAIKLKDRVAGDGSTTGAVTLIYQGAGSCVGAGSISGNTTLTGLGQYYTDVGAAGQHNCSFDTSAVNADGGSPITKSDVGISDVFFETCGIGARPANVADFPGPAQAMLFIVPTASQAPSTITAEEAADVWGCGQNGHIVPWLVENAIQQRNGASGTQNVVAKSIGVMAGAFHGSTNGSGDLLVASLLNRTLYPDATTAIGFLAADTFDSKYRSTTRALAFRGSEQTLAYYADSGAETFDKRNVRDGHYLAWGYEHLMAKVDSSGKPATVAAQNFIDWVQANPNPANPPNFDPTQLQSVNHVIPLCAMKVQRKSDGGFLSPYTPADPCSCLFEASNNGGIAPTGCVACTTDAPCGTGTHCHHGYCE